MGSGAKHSYPLDNLLTLPFFIHGSSQQLTPCSFSLKRNSVEHGVRLLAGLTKCIIKLNQIKDSSAMSLSNLFCSVPRA